MLEESFLGINSHSSIAKVLIEILSPDFVGIERLLAECTICLLRL